MPTVISSIHLFQENESYGYFCMQLNLLGSAKSNLQINVDTGGDGVWSIVARIW
jgi:hypothetical protein